MNIEVFEKLAERNIQEAIEQGKFDNLPGKGKPIVFEDDLMTPPHLRVVNRILKNAGAVPEWVQIRKDILAEQKEIGALRERLVRECPRRRANLASFPPGHAAVRQFAQWHAKSRTDYLRRMKWVNSAALKFAMIAPSTAEQFTSYRIDDEMRAFDHDFPGLVEEPAVDERNDPHDSSIRTAARALYQKQ